MRQGSKKEAGLGNGYPYRVIGPSVREIIFRIPFLGNVLLQQVINNFFLSEKILFVTGIFGNALR